MKNILSRPRIAVPVTAAVTLALLAGSALPANAAVTAPVQSTAQYFSGSLLNTVVGSTSPLIVASYSGSGNSQSFDRSNPLAALANQVLGLAGNPVTVPANFSNIGLINVHASANDDGSALGTAGLLNSGTSTYDLSNAVSSLSIPGTAEIGGLALTVGAVSSSATNPNTGVPTRAYNIASGKLTFVSPTLAALNDSVNTQVAALQTSLDALDGANGTIAGELNSLANPALDTHVSVSPVNLSNAVAGLQSGTLSGAAYPGVTIDLATGKVTLDLDALTPLNSRDPNTAIITPALLTKINASITALASAYGDRVTAALTSAINPSILRANANAPQSLQPVIAINQTLKDTIAGTPVIPVFGSPITSAVQTAALTAAISGLTTGLNGLTDTLVVPVLRNVLPAVTSVVAAVVQLTVNVQSQATENVVYAASAPAVPTTVYRETALRLDVLPTMYNAPTNALVLNMANSSVTSAPSAYIYELTPNHGPEAGGTTVTISGGCFTGATGVSFGGVAGVFPVVVDDSTITVTVPAGVGTKDVTVTGSLSCGNATLPQSYTYDPAAAALTKTTITDITPNSGPEAGGTQVTITGTCFTGAVGVTFGSVSPASYVIVNDTTILATAPAGTGTVDVTVSGSPACGTATYPNSFHYIPAPVTKSFIASAGDTILAFTGGGIASWLIPIGILALIAGLVLMIARRRVRS